MGRTIAQSISELFDLNVIGSGTPEAQTEPGHQDAHGTDQWQMTGYQNGWDQWQQNPWSWNNTSNTWEDAA